LPAGHLTDKTRGLLSRAETGKIFRELSLQYNYVFVDSAPVMASADTLSLSKHVDGVLMLVRKDFTRLRRLESALHRFDMIGVPVLGLLSIGLGDSATSYGYGYGYGYHGVKPRHSGADSNGDMARVPQLVDASSTASV
jgi:Mrp family chromosome partitioning ATPase